MQATEAILKRVEDLLHWGGCLALAGVAAAINADIILRLLFAAPLQGQFELTELYLMPALATLSLARVFRDGGHLALDIVPEGRGAFGLWARRTRLALAAGFFVAVAIMSGRFAWAAFASGAIEYGVVDWPLGWAYAPIPLGTGALALRLLAELAKTGAQDARAADDPGDDPVDQPQGGCHAELH